MTEPSVATLRRHAEDVAEGREVYAIDHYCAEALQECAEAEQEVRTEVVERNGAIIVRAINHDAIKGAT